MRRRTKAAESRKLEKGETMTVVSKQLEMESLMLVLVRNGDERQRMGTREQNLRSISFAEISPVLTSTEEHLDMLGSSRHPRTALL